MTDNKLLMNDFKTSVLKDQIIPCIKKDITDIINDRRRWSKVQIVYEYLRDIIIVASFISVFFNYKVVTGLLVSLTGYFIKLASHADSEEKKLTKKLDLYLSQLGITQLIPDVNLFENEDNKNKIKDNTPPV